MNHQQKIEKLKSFSSESEFRIFLIDLLRRMGYKDVTHTHRYGSPELGKDIIGRLHHVIDGEEWYAFVVKYGRIGGGTVQVEEIKSQVKQSFEYPYDDLSGNKIKINKVKVVTNENFTNGAQLSIGSSNDLKALSNIDYWYHENLITLIDEYYKDFWLPGDEFCKEYTKYIGASIQQEFELRDLSFRIEDKKIKKLVNLFVEPILTEAVVEKIDSHSVEVSGEKKITRKKITINSIAHAEENIIITGEPGSGKTKLINNIALSLLNAEKNAEEKTIPIKLKGKQLKEYKFDIEHAITSIVETSAPETYSRTNLAEYRKILLIDEIDVLNKEEKEQLVAVLNDYCKDGNKYILAQRKNDNLDLETDDKGAKSVRIQNFNLKQVESFIQKYFEGSDRGLKFIQILRESNLFAKLPTTPLTITLLSLLYDENGYEIPATITDIYDDFTKVMLGKLEIRSRAELLLLNIKRRLFSYQALRMLDKKIFEIPFEDFCKDINSFLKTKGYETQNEVDIVDLIENSGMLYIDHQGNVGFKQQAFIEYLASIEIYDHARRTHYDKLLNNFNDVAWQNTAIFFAGKSKDFPDMINDLIEKMPNDNLRDWFINAGGMGYLSQALYLTDSAERKKLVKKGLENMVSAFYVLKDMSGVEGHFFSEMSLPMIASLLSGWFVENFKSVTLKSPLHEIFNDLLIEYETADINDFDGDFKLFMVASTLMQKNISDESAFNKLIERNSFIKNPVLMISGDLFLETGDIQRKEINEEIKKKITKQIKHHHKAIHYIIKEPAYRFNEDYEFLDKEESLKLLAQKETSEVKTQS